MSDLYTALFDRIAERNRHLQTVRVSEGVTGNMEFRTGNGELIGSIREGVLGEFHATMGDQTATISEHVTGGAKIDFGNGDTINSYENIYGGETFHSLTEVTGYTKPDVLSGGVDLFSGTHEKIASLSSADMFGHMDLTVSPFAADGGDAVAGILSIIADWS